MRCELIRTSLISYTQNDIPSRQDDLAADLDGVGLIPVKELNCGGLCLARSLLGDNAAHKGIDGHSQVLAVLSGDVESLGVAKSGIQHGELGMKHTEAE